MTKLDDYSLYEQTGLGVSKKAVCDKCKKEFNACYPTESCMKKATHYSCGCDMKYHKKVARENKRKLKNDRR